MIFRLQFLLSSVAENLLDFQQNTVVFKNYGFW
jgi:hypothetical protein